MRRREFIAALGGAAAWPVAVRAQQTAHKVWHVGFLSPHSPADEGAVANTDAFTGKLQELGYIAGKNLRLDVRLAEGDLARLPPLAVELVSLAPDVIVGANSAATAALQRATSSIPIVMGTTGDPIGAGFIKSLARPGGNITGTTSQSAELTAKGQRAIAIVLCSGRHKDSYSLGARNCDVQKFKREVAVYVDKILKGASPADLPVEQPTRLELQVNLKTANALGLTIPDSILVRADKVFE